MKKFLIGLVILVVVLVGAAWIVPPLLPADTYRAEIQDRFEAATGRKLTIRGDISLRVLPTIALTANDVTIDNLPGAPSPRMAHVKRLELRLKVMPLLSGDIHVDRFVLVEPDINLERDKTGRPNWDFGSGKADAAPPAKAPSDASPPSGSAGGGSGGALKGLRLADVRIENGAITYRDAGVTHAFTAVSMVLGWGEASKPVEIDGTFTLRGRKLSVKARFDNPQSLEAGQGASVALNLKTEAVTVAFNGKIPPGTDAKGSGSLSVQIPSLKGLLAWATGRAQPGGGAPDAISLTSPVTISEKAVSFDQLKLTLDKIGVTGRLAVAFGGVPTLSGKLTAASLNLDSYLGAPGSAAPAKPSQPGWSTEPIDASALRALNADLTLDLAGLRLQGFAVDKADLRLRLSGGSLIVDVTQLKLYGGQGAGTLRLAALRRGVSIAPNLKFRGVNGERLITALAGSSRIQGTANIDVNMRGQGASQRDIVGSLAGTAQFVFANGALKGFNLAAMLRSFNPGQIARGFNDAQKTDFAELSAGFTAKNGVLTTDSLKMQSPLIRMTGAGTIPLPPRSLNLLLKPKLVGTIKGQGGKFDRAGVEIPVRVSGPWSNPSFRPDFAAALKQQLPDSIKKKVPKGVLDKLPKGLPKLR